MSPGAATALTTALAVALAASAAAAPAPIRRPSLVRLTFVEPTAEVAGRDARWQRALEGGTIALGETLRLGAGAVARLELPWMALTLSAGAELRFPDALLLSAVLESGRALVVSEGRESMKLVTREVEVRGKGRAVVRRQGGATLVTCLAGRFRVASARGSVSLGAGETSASLPERPPGPPAPAPAAPDALWPGADPAYAERAVPLELRWSGSAAAYQIELLPVGSDLVLLQRDVGGPPAALAIPWHGAFRWRVTARDERGAEGPPSQEGLIAVE